MRKSRLSQHKQNRLIELFFAGSTARTADSLVGINTKSSVYYFYWLCKLIYHNNDCIEQLAGEIKVDES